VRRSLTARQAATAYRDVSAGQPLGASHRPRPLAPRARARRATPDDGMLYCTLLRRYVAARPRQRLLRCGPTGWACRWARIGRSRPGQGGTLVGRRGRPAQPARCFEGACSAFFSWTTGLPHSRLTRTWVGLFRGATFWPLKSFCKWCIKRWRPGCAAPSG
jgi:hypothetical protein